MKTHRAMLLNPEIMQAIQVAREKHLDPSYPYWQQSSDGDLALYWSKVVEVNALVRQADTPGKFRISYSDANAVTWAEAEVEASNFDEAKKVAEALLRITLATGG